MRVHFSGLWRHPDFVRLWAGTTLSTFGSMVGNTAMLFTAVAFLEAAAWELAVLSACTLVPGFAFALVGGAWVDRLSRKTVLVWSDLGRFAAIGTIPIAALFDALTMWQMYAVAVAVTTLKNALHDPAYEAFLPQLIERKNLVEGNSKLSASAAVAEATGFSIGGWLIVLFKAPGALVVDAVSFLVSAAFISRIKADEVARIAVDREPNLLREMRDGLAYVVRSPVLRSLAAADFFLALGSGMIGVVFLLYLEREVGFNAGVLGMIFAVGGVTSLGAALVANRLLSGAHFGVVMVLSLALIPVGALTMPLAVSTSAVGAGLLVMGQLITDPGWTTWEIAKVSVRQGVTPDELLGRMNGSMRVVEFAGAALGALAAGVFGSTLGAREALFLAAGVMVMPAGVLLLSPLVRMARPPVRVEALGDAAPAAPDAS